MSDLGSVRHMIPAFGDTGSAHWEIKGAPHVMMRLKRIFPKVETKRGGSILLSDTPEIAAEIEWVLGWFDLEVSDSDRDHLSRRTAEHRERKEAVAEILAGTRAPMKGWQEPATHVDAYQLQAADLALTTGGLLVADELGMGKTFTALLMLRDPRALPALIVVPTHLPQQWQKQLQELLPWLTSHVIRTRAVYDPARKREMKGHDPEVLIISYSKLEGWADHLAGAVRSVIFDECHELRRAGSNKTKAAGTIADQADFRMGLSGTPVYNYGGEIYNVLDVIAPGHLGSREEFFREWGSGTVNEDDEDPRPGKRLVRARALGHYLREEALLLRRTWKDVDRKRPMAPVKIEHTVDSDQAVLDKVARDTRRLAELILSQAGSQEDQFAARAELDMRLRQATGVAKAPYVAEFVRMLLEADEEQRVLLFGWHRAVYTYWADSLSEFNPVAYTGSESKTQKAASKEAFVDGDARVMMMSLRSGAGVDGLQKASNVVVFGELDWSPAMHDQCIGRLARHGQRDQVLAYFLVSNEGSDPPISEILGTKRMQQEPLRDPDGDLFEPIDDSADRMKRLAESVLNSSPREEAA